MGDSGAWGPVSKNLTHMSLEFHSEEKDTGGEKNV